MKLRIQLLFTFISFTILFTQSGIAQNDSTNTELNTAVTDSIVKVEIEVDSTIIASDSTGNELKSESDGKVTGVAVSPAHMHLAIKPGEDKEMKITVTNGTDRENSFKISLVDFDMNDKGKPMFLAPDSARTYSLARWASVAPTFITLKPFEKRKVSIRISIPDNEEGRKAAWTVAMIEQQLPRETLDPENKEGGTVAFGITSTFSFGIFIYQNPPNVDNNNIEITNFKYVKQDSSSQMIINAMNSGDGIAYCVSYVDLTNLTTGYNERLLVKRFTIVPQLERVFKFVLPKELPKGEYIAVGVVDFKDAEEIKAAKTTFKIE